MAEHIHTCTLKLAYHASNMVRVLACDSQLFFVIITEYSVLLALLIEYEELNGGIQRILCG